MPTNLITHTDPLALTALGFLAAVLILSIGLFGWLMTQGGKRRRN